MDVQIQLRVEEEWTGRRLWAGGIGLPEDSAGAGAHHGAGRDGVALQASNFLKDQRAQQDLKDQKGQTEPT